MPRKSTSTARQQATAATSVRKHTKPTFDEMRPIILQIAEQYGATNVRVFGSFVRGEQRKGSDIDLLVTLPSHASLLDHAGLKVDLEEALGRKVDVVADDSIKPALRSRILSEAKPL